VRISTRPASSRVLLAVLLLTTPHALISQQPTRGRPRAPAPQSGTMGALVFQTDLGQTDGSVASMKGVALGVEATLQIHDLTHLIPPFDIREAAVRLRQTVPYWPEGTVFVSVVDPGVGTGRRAVVVRTRGGRYVVTPDNGTLTFLADALGFEEVRELDERAHRLPGSERSHTFDGRDIFAYTGARLASGKLRFEEVGAPASTPIVRLSYDAPRFAGESVVGGIVALDGPFGNLWSNIPVELLDRLGLRLGDTARVRITNGNRLVFAGAVPFVRTFGSVPEGRPLLYLNSVLDVGLAINQGNFAQRHRVRVGSGWRVEIAKR
jgi:S-adenosylmethionine hydrolase